MERRQTSSRLSSTISRRVVEPSSHLVLIRLPEKNLQIAIRKLVAAEIHLRRIQPHRFGLEDAFMSMVQSAPDTVGGVIQ